MIQAETDNDRLLLKRSAGGDEEAFRCIVDRHGRMVYNTCFRILNNMADAEDASQSVFLVFLKKCGKLSSKTRLGGWLYNTACFVSRQYIRAQHRRKKHEKEAGSMKALKREDRGVTWKQIGPELDNALNSLSSRYRDIIVMCCLEGQDTMSAARNLGIPQSTVTTRLARAKEKLAGFFRKRGIVLSVPLLTAFLAHNCAEAAVPSALNASLCGLAEGTAVSVKAAAMAEAATKAAFWINMKKAACIAAAVLLLAGAGIPFLLPSKPAETSLAPSPSAKIPEQTAAVEEPVPEQQSSEIVPYKEYYENGKLKASGFKQDGKPTGNWKWWFKHGPLQMKGNYSDGFREGKWVYNFPCGRKAGQGFFKKDRMTGIWTEFYDNGEKKATQEFKDNKKHGLYVRYHKNGTKGKTMNYINGQAQGEMVQYYDNGDLWATGEYANGEKTGVWTEYHTNGNKKARGMYANSKKTGTWKFWDPCGILTESVDHNTLTRTNPSTLLRTSSPSKGRNQKGLSGNPKRL